MSKAARQRQHGQSRNLRAFGLFVAVWLNLALQPCAMAFAELDEPDCPHCPPSQMQAHEHGAAHAAMERDAPCADGVADCAVVDSINHDRRGNQPKLEFPGADLPVVIGADNAGDAALRPSRRISFPEPLYYITGSPPPLHVLYCVYLD